jgi:hypothetical protein
MNTLFKSVAAAAVLSVAIAAPAEVRADALPKSMLGAWCIKGDGYGAGTYEKRNCKDNDGTMTVKPNSVDYWEDGCTFSSITTRFGTSYFTADRRPTPFPVYEVKARCSGEGENWSATLFFELLGDGKLDHKSFSDNELPSEIADKTFCKADDKTYFEGDGSCEGIGLRFERDRYTIVSGGESIGFCRFASVKTVWDQNLGVATKLTGGPVTYIAAQCAHTQKLLAMFVSKGTTYVVDKGK